MCTLVILRRPEHDWPVIVGANRDEMTNRAWQPPGRHWSDRPDIVAGLDELAGGSWMGVNDHGVMAAILNRAGTLGPEQGKRTRGELVLDALDYADAVDAATWLAAVNPDAYRPFNLVIADNRDAYWLAHRGEGRIQITTIPDGISMLTSRELNDETSPRIARYRESFRTAAAPDPAEGDWSAWEDLFSDRSPDPESGPSGAMRFALPSGFGTVSNSLMALPAAKLERKPIWRFARVAPSPTGWSPVRLG